MRAGGLERGSTDGLINRSADPMNEIMETFRQGEIADTEREAPVPRDGDVNGRTAHDEWSRSRNDSVRDPSSPSPRPSPPGEGASSADLEQEQHLVRSEVQQGMQESPVATAFEPVGTDPTIAPFGLGLAMPGSLLPVRGILRGVSGIHDGESKVSAIQRKQARQ